MSWGERKQRHVGQNHTLFHFGVPVLTSCKSKMPSLFLVCFGTRIFLCLLFSTQVDFEARTTKKYWPLFLKGDCIFARQMPFPDWESGLVLVAALTFVVVGGHKEDTIPITTSCDYCLPWQPCSVHLLSSQLMFLHELPSEEVSFSPFAILVT